MNRKHSDVAANYSQTNDELPRLFNCYLIYSVYCMYIRVDCK